MQACLNSQVIRKVKKVKQNKTNKKTTKKVICNESTLTKTYHDPQSVSTRYVHIYRP